MVDWITRPVDTVVSSLTAVPLAERERMRDGPVDAEQHRRYFSDLAALREIEVGGADPVRRGAPAPIRVAAWNVERLRHLDAIGDTLARVDADIALLSEIDVGMARSGNRHGVAELAARLGHSYAYGVEFIELDGGGADERAANAGAVNAAGFHGNAVTSNMRLHRPFLARLDAQGAWFGWERDQPRVGGRMAIGAQVELAGHLVTVVSVHLESHSGPGDRATQAAQLLDVIDKYDAHAPVLLGGDFNTSTVERARDRDEEFRRAELLRDPMRALHVESYEPLFAHMASRGFDWRACNDLDTPTERPAPGRADRPLGKIDWFFTRGLRASGPAVIPALTPAETPSSDHDCLLVTIEPEP